MIKAWRVHVLYDEQAKFVETARRMGGLVWDMPVDVFLGPHFGRNIVVCYVSEEEKTVLKLKFDLIEDEKICDKERR